MPQTLSTGDLQYRTGAVVKALAAGQAFLWVVEGKAIAQLTPITEVPSAQKGAPALSLAISLQQMVAWLGEAGLSRVLGLTQATFATQYGASAFSPPVQDRLMALSSALAEQAAFLPSTRLRTWWFRRHRALRGRSPVEYLAQPWNPGDARSITVFQIIHQDFLMSSLPSHARSGK